MKPPPNNDARVQGGRQLLRGGAGNEQSTRRPPSFQEYGSDLLTLECVRLMSLGERGLFATMRWFVWANDSLPKDPQSMARVLGLTTQEVRDHLTELVLRFFTPDKNDPTRLVCPELAAQMLRLKERRVKQADGGRLGARVRREKKFSANSNLEVNHEVDLKVLEKSRTEQNRAEPVYREPNGNDEFVAALDGKAGFES